MQRLRPHVASCILVGSALWATGRIAAQTITFRKIVDTSTTMPGSSVPFEFLGFPAVDGGTVVFQGVNVSSPTPQSGIYMDVGGTLTVVADGNTPVPGGGGQFVALSPPVGLDGQDVAFFGAGSTQFGVYTAIGGSLNLVADTNTPAPGGTGSFQNFFDLAIDGGHVAFSGDVTGSSTQEGFYTDLGGTLRVVADLSTPIPGGTGNFTVFSPGVSIDGGTVAFAGSGPGQAGVFLDTGGTLSVVVDRSTPIPGASGNFLGFHAPCLDGQNVAFRGGGGGISGVYARLAGQLVFVADNNTPVPGGTGDFQLFDFPSLDRGNVAFRGIGSSADGIYVFMGGSLIKVVDHTDSLDGANPFLLGSDAGALSGAEVAFLAFFPGGARGIFVATITDVCGNGIVETGEACDEGMASSSCDIDCTLVVCGDGTLNPAAGEACDDGVGNSDSTPDACRTDCTLPRCGDGVVDSGESCDDGNTIDGDGCQGNCLLPACGDGIVDPGEQCDDGVGNSDSTPDACRMDCTLPACGDGVLDSGEACDDGNILDADGCSSLCQIEGVAIPTLSQWGLVVMTLLLLTGAKIHFRRAWVDAGR